MSEILKKGWTRVAFGDVVRQVHDRVDPEKKDIERYVAGEHMDTDDLRLRRWGVIGNGYLGPAFHMRFKPGHVLYGSRRTYLRKVAVADFEGITANTTFVLESKDPRVLLPELLPFIMQTESFHEHSINQSKGSVNPYVNFSDLTWYEFSLPPLGEQRLIAEVLKAHLEARESLRVVFHQTAILRRTLLQKYFPSSSESPGAVALKRLADSGDIEFQTGPFGTVLAASEYRQVGWPVVNPTNIRNGEMSREGAPCVGDATAKRLQTYRLREGDILLARKGDFDKAVVARAEHVGWIGGSDTIRLRCTSARLSSSYLHLCLQAPNAGRMLYSYAHGTVMPGLNEKVLGHLVLNLRSPREQEIIVGIFCRLASAERELRARDRMSGGLFELALNEVISSREDGL